jgi:hypothetical protein
VACIPGYLNRNNIESTDDKIKAAMRAGTEPRAALNHQLSGLPHLFHGVGRKRRGPNGDDVDKSDAKRRTPSAP